MNFKTEIIYKDVTQSKLHFLKYHIIAWFYSYYAPRCS